MPAKLAADEAVVFTAATPKLYGATSTIPDDPEGFATFYRMLFRRDIPLHAMHWVFELYAARDQGKGLIIEAFRGSSKTTSITIAFLAFRIGLNPQDSFLLLQATAAAARVTCRQVADLIEHNAGFHIAFPHVVPDKKLSWSMSRGFEVKRDDTDYTAWRQLCAETKGRDPSFIGLGYRSSFVVGLHPTGMLLADDIHNETNTRSVKEMDKAVAIITSNILPTLNPTSWKIFIGTPWRQGDVLQYLKATQTYASVSTPIYTEIDADEDLRRGEVSSPAFDSVISSDDDVAVGAQHAAPAIAPIEKSDEPVNNFPLSRRGEVSSPASAPIKEPASPESHQSSSAVGAHRNAPAITPIENSSEPVADLSTASDLELRTSDVGLRTLDIELTWPDRFPISVIENYRQMLGEREFARMYLLDLSAAEGIHLKSEWLHKVDSANIQPAWPVVMGVDYASTADKQRDNDRDYFAVAIGRAQPSGSGIILIDGFRGRLSLAEAQDKLLELVAFYPNTEVIGIEAVGKGEEFYHSLSSHPSLPIVSMNPGGQGKGRRFQNAMAPLFERGWARITDAESPFLQSFRHEWLRWPWGDHDDTLDATYWMLRAGQYHLPPSTNKPRVQTPFSALGRK